MILIDAVYINITGGKMLLDILIEELEKKDLEIYYLLDYRIINNHPKIAKKNKIKYLKGSLINRLVFYRKNQHKFKKILCFGNFPPPLKLQGIVYTYFQNVLLSQNKFISIKWYLKRLVFNKLSKNTDFWIVQTKSVKNLLQNYLSTEKLIFIYPFFKKFDFKLNKKKKEIDPLKGINFLYVSSGEVYKNHKNLISAFVNYNKIYKSSSLTLTVSKNYTELYALIQNCVSNGINIYNKGLIDKQLLSFEYEKADVFIFPSSFESFGLGLAEAVQFGLPVLAANLPYVFDVISPSSTFNPHDTNSIFKSMKDYEKYSKIPSKIIINNKLNEMINSIFLY